MDKDSINKDRQMFKMFKDGLDAIAQKVAGIKIDAPKIELNNNSVAEEIKKTNTILQSMLDEDMKEEKDEELEITLKIE